MTFDSLLAVSTLAQQDASAPQTVVAPTTSTKADGTATVTPTATPPASPLGTFGLPILILGGFAVMMWFSSRKQKKAKETMNSSLIKGAKVTTIGGARGRVAELTDADVTVQFEDCRITFLRSAIQSVDQVPV